MTDVLWNDHHYNHHQNAVQMKIVQLNDVQKKAEYTPKGEFGPDCEEETCTCIHRFHNQNEWLSKGLYYGYIGGQKEVTL